MTELATAATGPPAAAATADADKATTTRLLLAGALAGPLYLVVTFAQVLTRAGFDLREHPLSLLSTGDLGWIQIANFVLSGLGYVAAAVGIRRALRGGRAGTWGPILIGTFGVGLVWGGVFVADPADGFPVGTPADAADPTWHGILHSVAPAVAFLALAVACVVFARRFAARGQRRWTAFSVATAVALFVPDLFMASGYFYVALALAAAVGWGWASALCARLAHDPRQERRRLTP
jgi:hypothetical protein